MNSVTYAGPTPSPNGQITAFPGQTIVIQLRCAVNGNLTLVAVDYDNACEMLANKPAQHRSLFE